MVWFGQKPGATAATGGGNGVMMIGFGTAAAPAELFLVVGRAPVPAARAQVNGSAFGAGSLSHLSRMTSDSSSFSRRASSSMRFSGADGAHDQPDGQRDGNTKNQKDHGYPVHKFYLSTAAQPDCSQCATGGGFVASGNTTDARPHCLNTRFTRQQWQVNARFG